MNKLKTKWDSATEEERQNILGRIVPSSSGVKSLSKLDWKDIPDGTKKALQSIKLESVQDLVESDKSPEEIINQISEASMDQQIMQLYLDYRDDQMMTHSQALSATSKELNIADTDILDSLKTSNVQGLSD